MSEPLETKKIFEAACNRFARGHLVLADFLLREIFERDPEHPGGLNLLGEISLALGFNDKATDAFERAIDCDPGLLRARENLEKAQRPRPRCEDSDLRYLLVKAWGFGFWSDVSHTLACLLLSEISGRIPVVHWGHNSLFRDDPEDDAFRLYFDPVSDVTIDDLAATRPITIFPDKWSVENLRAEEYGKWEGDSSRLGGINFLNHSETLAVVDFYVSVIELMPWLPKLHPMADKSIDEVFQYLTAKYLRPRAAIMDEVRLFHEAHLAGRFVIAAHLRGSDKRLETGEADDVNGRCLDAIDLESSDATIFVMTDDARCLALAHDRFGDRVVATDCQRTANDTGPHLLSSNHRVRLGGEVMVDTYIALGCDKFIGNGHSSVSAMIAVLKQWPTSACQLIASPRLHKRNLDVYTMADPKMPEAFW